MPKDVRIIPAQGSIDFSLSQGFVTSLIQLSDAGLLSIASTGPIQVGATTITGLRVAQSGFVGIGTISPTQNLHIQGNARLTGALFDRIIIQALKINFLYLQGLELLGHL